MRVSQLEVLSLQVSFGTSEYIKHGRGDEDDDGEAVAPAVGSGQIGRIQVVFGSKDVPLWRRRTEIPRDGIDEIGELVVRGAAIEWQSVQGSDVEGDDSDLRIQRADGEETRNAFNPAEGLPISIIEKAYVSEEFWRMSCADVDDEDDVRFDFTDWFFDLKMSSPAPPTAGWALEMKLVRLRMATLFGFCRSWA